MRYLKQKEGFVQYWFMIVVLISIETFMGRWVNIPRYICQFYRMHASNFYACRVVELQFQQLGITDWQIFQLLRSLLT